MQQSNSNGSSSFASNNNLCGTDLLGLVSRGHVIITELLTLSGRIPPAFVEAASSAAAVESKDRASSSSHNSSSSYVWSLFGGRKDTKQDTPIQDGEGEEVYAQFLFDFEYLRDPEGCERSIGSATAAPRRLESDFVSKHGDTIARFYHLFEGIYLYEQELNKFASDLSGGRYVQYTTESVLLDPEGRQLAAEAVHLFAAMLILVETHFDGSVRERIIVAFLRYRAKGGFNSKMNSVCKLFASIGTGLASGNADAPFEEMLFSRCSVNDEFVQKVIGCLMAENIYPQSDAVSFPDFEHRSTRLAKQASLLYTILYLQLDILRSDEMKMRAIVDRFFSDNWMVAIDSGLIIDLSKKWSNFGAARAAIGNVASSSMAKDLYAFNHHSMKQCTVQLHGYLTHGNLTDELILKNKSQILDCARRSNVALRWSILHRNSSAAKREASPRASVDVVSALDGPAMDVEVLQLLLLTAHFEDKVRQSLSRILDTREDIWVASRSEVVTKLSQVSSFFRKNEKGAEGDDSSNDENLIKWFEDMGLEVESLSLEDAADAVSSTFTKAQFCIEALQEMAQYEIIDSSLHLKTTLVDAQNLLHHMVRVGTFTPNTLLALNNISEMTYAEDAIKVYSPIFQEKITKDPASTVSLLRSLFLKLSHCLEAPVHRLVQWKGNSYADTQQVRFYHENSFASLISSILQVIPSSVFNLVLSIADVKGRMIEPVPAKIETSSLAKYAQSDQRYQLSLLEYEISVFTEGVTRMQVIPIGGTEVNPTALLHIGLKKELVKHISVILHHTLRFQQPMRSGKKGSAIMEFKKSSADAVSLLTHRLDSLRQALEYVQDYTGLAGSVTFQEELGRIIAFNVEQESNKYKHKRIHHSESVFQCSQAPIPRFAPTEQESLYENFMGRTMSALLKLTEPQKTIYSLDSNGWFLPDGRDVAGGRIIAMLREAMGTQGLVGIDKLLSYRILNELQRFVKSYRAVVKSHGVLLEQLRDGMFPEWKMPADPHQFYETATKKTAKLMSPILICLRRVGQAQLLRRAIRRELQIKAEVDAKRFKHATNALSLASLASAGVEEGLEVAVESLAAIGEGDPLATEFLRTDPLEGLPVLLAVFVIAHARELTYDADFGSLVRLKEEYAIDGWPFVFGMATLLRQFHPSYSHSALAYIGQYIRSQIGSQPPQSSTGKKVEENVDVTPEVKNVLVFAHQFCSVSSYGAVALYEHIPQYLTDMIGGSFKV